MADMATPIAVAPPSAEITAAHDAALAFSQAAGAKMKAADTAVATAKKALAAALEAQVAAHAEAAAANVVLDAVSAAVNGTTSHRVWYAIGAICAAVVVAGVVWHFV